MGVPKHRILELAWRSSADLLGEVEGDTNLLREGDNDLIGEEEGDNNLLEEGDTI
jgi:hypothetical protein